MAFGGSFGATDTDTTLACLDAMLDAAITFLDTANIHGMGIPEPVIGGWPATRNPQIPLATKAAVVNRDHVGLFSSHRRDHTRPCPRCWPPCPA